MIDTIIYSRRKKLLLQVTQDQKVIVKAPYFMPKWYIYLFVYFQSSWIQKQKEKISEKKRKTLSSRYILFLGEQYYVEVNKHIKKVIIEDMQFIIPQSKDALKKWYMKEAKLIIPQRVEYFSKKFNFQYKSIRITSARTRWGSCSALDNLNFSWRLVMAPQEAIDYVVIHELAHTVHKNHSKQFWDEVHRCMPDYLVHKKWLKDHAYLVHRLDFEE